MTEWRLFDGATSPIATREWYAGRAPAAHLEMPDHQERLAVAAKRVQELASMFRLTTVVDLGCGDGGLLSTLDRVRRWGYDLTPTAPTAGRARGVDVRYLDVIHDEPEWADIAVCTEMLEHLEDPHTFLARVFAHCTGLVCSSPATENDREHYEHHLWAWDVDGFRTMVENAGWRVLRHDRVSWYQVLAAVRPGPLHPWDE
jgi:2-polyprenyl-3-methyl-5-hydroxy-6-metoxy-1,4-benzoquinol methylase